eukprot:7511341-Alexandrium_andersonii.AAC.1
MWKRSNSKTDPVKYRSVPKCFRWRASGATEKMVTPGRWKIGCLFGRAASRAVGRPPRPTGKQKSHQPE